MSLKNLDWKHGLGALCVLGVLISLGLAEQAKEGATLPFHLTAGGLAFAALVFGAIGRQLGANVPTTAGQRGVARLGMVLGLAFMGIFLLALIVRPLPSRTVEPQRDEVTMLDRADVARALQPSAGGQGCAWFDGNKNTISSDGAQVLECVLSALFTGGLTDPRQIAAQCTGVTVADIEQIVASLISYFDTPAGDAGPSASALVASGNAPARLKGARNLPASISLDQLAKLRAVHAAAAYKLAHGG